MPIVQYLLIYLLGGITLLPGVLLYVWYVHIAKRNKQQGVALHFPSESYTSIDEYQTKKGWIRLVEYSSSPLPPVKKVSSFTKTMAAMTTYSSKSGNSNAASTPSSAGSAPPVFSSSTSTLFYAILRHGTLFCFDNEQEKTCHLILPLHSYKISLYPKEGKREAELFGRLMSICIAPKSNPTTSSTYYLSCRRPTDKEDWYFAMTAASQPDLQPWKVSTKYDTVAMTQLRGLLDGTPAQVEAQCWNAIMGRLFLGVYKTEHWQQLWKTKMKNKLARMNVSPPLPPTSETTATKPPSLMHLSPFQLQFISMGDTIPCLTDAKLVEFGTDGNCVIQGDLRYDGSIHVVIRTAFYYIWPTLASTFEKSAQPPEDASSPPGSLPLVLSIKLRHCSGKVVFKVKPPPSGRIWAGFQDMPLMDWEITPVVMDTQIKLSLVTNLIQEKLKEMVLETLVLPNMEDFPFFDSEGLGGIFGDRLAKEDDMATPPAAAPEQEPSPEQEPKEDSAITIDEVASDPPMVSSLVQEYLHKIKNTPRSPPPSPYSST
jgi:hypothetical protein